MVTFFVPGIKLCFSGTKFHYILQALTFPQKYAKLTLKQSSCFEEGILYFIIQPHYCTKY